MPEQPPPVARVIGAGGLLGSAVCEALALQGASFNPAKDLAWPNHDRLADQFHELTSKLETECTGRPWLIFWCAGVGHVGADAAVHEADQAVLRLMLNAVRRNLRSSPGVFVLASSAGAVYSANRVWPATEATPPLPHHGYGESKLAQEALVQTAVEASPTMRAVLLRISNLYGVGQAIGKPQGLLSHLVANTFRRVPSTIYVPLDTSRDYLFTSDAAAMAIRAAKHGLADQPGGVTTRILASERNHTIAQLLGVLSKIVKRRVPIIARPTVQTDQQPLMLSFRSNDIEQGQLAKVSIEEGISRLVAEYAHVRLSVRERV